MLHWLSRAKTNDCPLLQKTPASPRRKMEKTHNSVICFANLWCQISGRSSSWFTASIPASRDAESFNTSHRLYSDRNTKPKIMSPGRRDRIGPAAVGAGWKCKGGSHFLWKLVRWDFRYSMCKKHVLVHPMYSRQYLDSRVHCTSIWTTMQHWSLSTNQSSKSWWLITKIVSDQNDLSESFEIPHFLETVISYLRRQKLTTYMGDI